jgi:hypothetical protein
MSYFPESPTDLDKYLGPDVQETTPRRGGMIYAEALFIIIIMLFN